LKVVLFPSMITREAWCWLYSGPRLPSLLLNNCRRFNRCTKKYRKYGFEIVGVNLDEEEPAIDAFQEKASLDWRQIFYSGRDKRGWNNPAAVYYGVRTVPMLMLVDHTGVTELVTSSATDLEEPLRHCCERRQQPTRNRQSRY